MTMIKAVAIATIELVSTAVFTSAETAFAFSNGRARLGSIVSIPSQIPDLTKHKLPPNLPSHQSKRSNKKRTRTRIYSYRKFHDYGWDKLTIDNDEEIDTVPEELKSNTSPAKGAPEGTNVVVNVRSISQFPHLAAKNKKGNPDREVLRLARSAFLETQSPSNEALITPMTIHVLNFVLFPDPHIHNGHDGGDEENGGYIGLPIFGADIVSLPGNKHLVALDFQPVLPLDGGGKEKSSLFPSQYFHLEKKLEAIHSKYQKSSSDSSPLLPWGGDIPPQAERFFSPYALWTRLADENAINTVDTLVWEAFREYTDLYLELMNAVQDDVNSEKIGMGKLSDGINPVLEGQLEYLEYRRTNDPARPMLQRLYGNEWAEKVISDVLFPDL